MAKKITEIKIDQILWRHRRVFLIDAIDGELEKKLIKELLTLDAINRRSILLTIDSPGGNISSGLNIINMFSMIKAPIVTLISGEAASLAALISVCGDKRLMFKNSLWMAHPMSSGAIDYTSFIKDRVKGWDLWQKQIDLILKTKTKLPNKYIEEIKRSEKWLNASKCLEFGIVDKIV